MMDWLTVGDTAQEAEGGYRIEQTLGGWKAWRDGVQLVPSDSIGQPIVPFESPTEAEAKSMCEYDSKEVARRLRAHERKWKKLNSGWEVR